MPYADKETANRLMAGKRWGDRVAYQVAREGKALDLTVLLRRHRPKPGPAAAASESALPAAPAPASAAHEPPVPGPGAGSRARHALDVKFDTARGWLSVTDVLSVPAAAVAKGELQFLLHGALKLTSSDPPAVELPAEASAAERFFGIGGGDEDLYRKGKLKRYRLALPAAGGSVRLAYEGPFHFGLSDKKEEYTRGFRETSGMVSKDGLYLAGSGFWYPYLGRELVEFEIVASQPEGWHLIAPGKGRSRDADGRARWDSQGPVDEITLVGGPLVVYRESAGAVETLAYLRQKDDTLAAKYLEATAQYLEMYRGLVGPYPYGKFALVENFWETGYGMPSYTLLGPQVIRFPFILTSSYPHEILHNWWGNGVFVDYASGNWSEGLTAYLADHLIQEQRGRGDEYRRDTLAKYRSYVKEGRDFPLAEFRSRESAATEAVGYGKTLMLFHMLRQRLGDDGFRQWAARFYRENRGRQASWSDVRKGMESVSKQDLGRLFADHVTRAGAAVLRVSARVVATSAGGHEVAGTLEQTQPGQPLALDVPLVVQTAGAPARTTLRLEGAKLDFRIPAEAAPLALHVDPGFDAFRLLDPRETPASIGQIFGEPKVLALLPAKATAAEQAAWRALVEGWRSDSHQPEIRTDAEVRELPTDRAVWILGSRNAFASRLFASGADYTLDETRLTVDRESVPLAGHAARPRPPSPVEPREGRGLRLRRPPRRPAGPRPQAAALRQVLVPGVRGRRAGERPEGTVDGHRLAAARWTCGRKPHASQHSQHSRPSPARRSRSCRPSSRRRRFSSTWRGSRRRSARAAASGRRASRRRPSTSRPGSRRWGCSRAATAGTYFQSFESSRSPSGAPVRLRNVIGVLPGSKPEWAGQSALLTAHYDHLGSGWPDVHKGDEGRLHPGADDNASGVAVMLELAKTLAAGEKPQRTLVFVAFAGEEAGMLGSRRYVEKPPFPLDKTIGVINLDTVGRLGSGKVSVLATGSASEWPHIFRGAGFVTGVDGRMIPDGLDSSDQKSFIDKGVPAVQIFTEPHTDYHRPGDSADKIDGAGLVKVATYVKEGIAYLGERPEPLTNTIASMKGAVAADGGLRAPAARLSRPPARARAGA